MAFPPAAPRPNGPPVPAGGAPGAGRRGWARAVRRGAATAGVAALLWLLGVWPPPVWWRSHSPRQTAMMEREASEQPRGNPPRYRPTPLAATAPALRRMVVIGEDSRFWTHHGIDPAEIADALGLEREGGMAAIRATWARRSRLRGASTITQQLAKNLYLSPSRSLLRKLKEAVTALRLEAALPKARILELYLSAVEWGPGIWGAEAASHRYFARSASELDDSAAAGLAAALPDPLRSNPARPSPEWTARRDRILERYYGKLVRVPPVVDSEPEPDTASGPPLP